MALVFLRRAGPVGGPIVAGARLRAGSRRLIAARVATALLAGLPAFALAWVSVAPISRRPWFTGPEAHAAVPTMDLFQAVGAPMAGAALLAAAVGWLCGLVLTGAALHVLATPHRPVRVWQAVRIVGLPRLWAFLRIACLASLANVAVVVVSGFVADALAGHGDASGWTGRTILVTLPLLRAAVVAMGLAFFGAWAHMCRVAVVAADLPVRRAVVAAARLMVSRPGPALIFPAVVGLLVPALGSVLLLGWGDAVEGVGTVLAAAAWLLWLVVQAFVWHWLNHCGRLTWGPPGTG